MCRQTWDGNAANTNLTHRKPSETTDAKAIGIPIINNEKAIEQPMETIEKPIESHRKFL